MDPEFRRLFCELHLAHFVASAETWFTVTDPHVFFFFFQFLVVEPAPGPSDRALLRRNFSDLLSRVRAGSVRLGPEFIGNQSWPPQQSNARTSALSPRSSLFSPDRQHGRRRYRRYLPASQPPPLISLARARLTSSTSSFCSTRPGSRLRLVGRTCPPSFVCVRDAYKSLFLHRLLAPRTFEISRRPHHAGPLPYPRTEETTPDILSSHSVSRSVSLALQTDRPLAFGPQFWEAHRVSRDIVQVANTMRRGRRYERSLNRDRERGRGHPAPPRRGDRGAVAASLSHAAYSFDSTSSVSSSRATLRRIHEDIREPMHETQTRLCWPDGPDDSFAGGDRDRQYSAREPPGYQLGIPRNLSCLYGKRCEKFHPNSKIRREWWTPGPKARPVDKRK